MKVIDDDYHIIYSSLAKFFRNSKKVFTRLIILSLLNNKLSQKKFKK